MTENLKCPFCQQELKCWDEPHDAIYSNWSCPNCRRFAYGNKLIWQELIRTRKALEMAITGLKNCKTRDHIGAVCRTPEYVDKVLEQIKTALEQKDGK